MTQKHVHYRERLYRERAHPPGDKDEFRDYRDSFSRVYFSATFFLFAEFLAEKDFTFIPSGLIFPMGFLIFWAVYYTYYRPTTLEEKIFFPERWNWQAIPQVLFGVAIWFVKISLRDFVAVLKFPFRAPPKRAVVPSRPVARIVYSSTALQNPEQLPREIQSALADLGFASQVRWEEIQHRYRQLAKRYHPDLNPDITRSGTRFMRLDQAYRRLGAVKHRYFAAK